MHWPLVKNEVIAILSAITGKAWWETIVYFVTNRNPYSDPPKFPCLVCGSGAKEDHVQGQVGFALWLIWLSMRVSHQQIPSQIPADLLEFLTNIARSLVFLSNLHSWKKQVRRLLPQPSGHTHSGDMCNMKPVCFSKKKKKKFFFKALRDTQLLLPEAEVSFQQAGRQAFADTTSPADSQQVRPALWFYQ